MTDDQIIIEVAKLDGLDEKYIQNYTHEGEQPSVWYAHPDIFQAKYLGTYLLSRDAIVPVIEKQNLTEEQWEAFLHYCIPDEADWIACNKLYTDKDFKLKQSRLQRAYRMLVLMKPRQLCEALLKACGKWRD